MKNVLMSLFITLSFVNSYGQAAVEDVVFDLQIYGGGEINSQIEGGISPYKYLWSNGSTLENLNSLYAGTYSLTITDVGGCTKTQSITLIEPTRLQVSSISSPALHGYNVSRHGGHNGAVNLNVTGGTPPYTYYWSSGDTTKDIDTVLTAHLYSGITDSRFVVIGDNGIYFRGKIAQNFIKIQN